MHALLARGIEKSWGDRHVLRGVDLTVGPRDRVGLVGANGSGKTTLLSILAGEVDTDHGQIDIPGRIAVLTQDPHLEGETVDETMAYATAWHSDLLAAWTAALEAENTALAGTLQDQLDIVGWTIEHRVDAVLERVGAPDRSAAVATLSGGERRRVALARALLQQADVLLLDEPTNHLDADTTEWLQAFLGGFRGAVVLVTHDRYLLEAVADRIVEIEDGAAVVYDDCSYADYLLARAERRMVLERVEDNRLAMIRREAEWASRSPAARSTKQTARLKRLDDLQAQQPLSKESSFTLDLSTGLRLGSTILELHGISKSYDDRLLIDDLTVALGPGDRLGILGPNGVGKSTLLRILMTQETADRGDIVRGRRVKVGMLDQHRTGLTDTDTLFEAVGQGNDRIEVGDHTIHVATFLERFLFPRTMHDTRVAGLSGGERARLLLAKLLLSGNNVLLLDEPTNDLDLLTLRVLEEALLNYDGCAIIVTHDRAFLDRVCTGVLAFEGEGKIVRYADRMQHVTALEKRRKADTAAKAEAAKAEAAAPKAPVPKAPKRSNAKRLSFKETRELESLPAAIEALETEVESLGNTLADPSTYQQRGDEVPELNRRLTELNEQVEQAYARWESLAERAD